MFSLFACLFLQHPSWEKYHKPIYHVCFTYVSTVQTFNSCTRRPVICQCLVVQIPVDNISKYNPKTSMAIVACESKSRSVVRPSVHPCPGNWWKAGVRSCIMPMHLVQELNVFIVCFSCIFIICHDRKHVIYTFIVFHVYLFYIICHQGLSQDFWIGASKGILIKNNGQNQKF